MKGTGGCGGDFDGGRTRLRKTGGAICRRGGSKGANWSQMGVNEEGRRGCYRVVGGYDGLQLELYLDHYGRNSWSMHEVIWFATDTNVG